MSWSTIEQRVRLAPWNRFKPSSKIFYWPFQCKVSKVAKIRNRYNQVPHLTQDTNGKVTNSQKTPQTRAKNLLILRIICVFVSCVYHAFVSVLCWFVVTCWERADLLALVSDVYCIFVTCPLVSWVRCGTWLCRFLIFVYFLTLVYQNRTNSNFNLNGI